MKVQHTENIPLTWLSKVAQGSKCALFESHVTSLSDTVLSLYLYKQISLKAESLYKYTVVILIITLPTTLTLIRLADEITSRKHWDLLPSFLNDGWSMFLSF